MPRAQLFFLSTCCVLAIFIAGCAPDPVESTIERLEALTDLLETHKRAPDALLKNLEAFVEKEKAGFKEDRGRVEELDKEAQEKLVAKHEKRLSKTLERLLDVTLEVQERLRSQPEKFVRFQNLMNQLE